MIISSAILHLFKYGYYLTKTINERVIISPLISSNSVEYFKTLLIDLPNKKSFYNNIYPVFLKMPNNKFINLINPLILIKDSLYIIRCLTLIKPKKIIILYALDAYPFIILKPFFKYSIYVMAIGGDINLHEGLFSRLLKKIILINSNIIFSFSEEIRNKIKTESGMNSLVTPTGIDASIFKPILVNKEKSFWNVRKDNFVILTVANLIKIKGIDVIIKSISILKNKYNNVKFLIAGDGPEKERLLTLVSELNLEENVFFLGHRNRSEIVELYNISDVFVLASYSEGLPASVLESMACGNVCISTEVGDVAKVIVHGTNGFLFKPGDYLKLAETIFHIKSLPEEDLSLIKVNARNTILSSYDINNIIKKIAYVVLNT